MEVKKEHNKMRYSLDVSSVEYDLLMTGVKELFASVLGGSRWDEIAALDNALEAGR